MVCPTTAFAAWDSTNLCVVLSFIGLGSFLFQAAGENKELGVLSKERERERITKGFW